MSDDISIKQIDDVTVVSLSGEINSVSAPGVQNEVMPLAETADKILLDMTEISYMSSAGLRILLALYRQTSARNAHVVLVGVNDDIQNVMSVTGFLQFFTISDTLEKGLEALSG